MLKTKKVNRIFPNFKESGINKVNIDEAVKEWDIRFAINQYDSPFAGVSYTFFAALRKNSKRAFMFKSQISKEDAKELIGRLNLTQYYSSVFINGSVWRKRQHA